VVALHAVMVGVSVAAGAPVIENAMDGWSGFAALTWVAQVMPLFFVLGGFSSATQWTKLRTRGVRPHEYLAMRLRRLLPPALGAIAACAAVLLALQAAGLPDALVAVAGFRLSQPLWFLGVYLLCTALVPAMTALHRLAPHAVLAGLATVVAVVDGVRAASGVDAIGFVNLLAVWLLVQQFGFWLADGRFDGWSRARLVVTAAWSLATLAALCGAGVFSPDLLQNLNPPTFALVLLGVAQLCGFLLVRGMLRRAHELPAIASVAGWVNARAMTIYSWHMLVLIALAGVLLLTGGEALPAPVTDAWWATRPAWLLAAGLCVAGVVALAGRIETRTPRAPIATSSIGSRGLPTVALLLAAGGVLVVLLGGSAPVSWAIAVCMIATSLTMARRTAA